MSLTTPHLHTGLLASLLLSLSAPAFAQPRDYNLAPEIKVKPRKEYEFAPDVKPVEVIRRREDTVLAPEAWRRDGNLNRARILTDEEEMELDKPGPNVTKAYAKLAIENLRCVSGGTIGRCLDRKAAVAGIMDDGWEITALGSGTIIVQRTIMFAKNLPIKYSWRVLENGDIEPASSRARMITVDVEDLDEYRLDELDSIYDAAPDSALR